MYGLRIRLEFNDDLDSYYAINLLQRDYSGQADVRELTGTPAIIEIGDSGAEEFPIVMGAMATVNFYAEDGDDWGVLYTADRRRFQLEIRKDNAVTGPIIFTGWLMPQEYSERLTWQPTLSIKAICGLGELKELDYLDASEARFSGRKSYLQILTDLLSKLNLNLPIHSAIDWRDSSMAAGDAFAQSFVDVSIYDGLNCREVLDQILIGCRIMQRSGAWYVESYTALKRATHTQYNYNGSGVFLSATEAVSLRGEINQKEIWTEGTPMLQRWPAYDKLILGQDYGKRESFFKNHQFSDGLDSWQNETGFPYLFTAPAESDDTFVKIDGPTDGGLRQSVTINVGEGMFVFKAKASAMGGLMSATEILNEPTIIATAIQVKLIGSVKTWYLNGSTDDNIGTWQEQPCFVIINKLNSEPYANPIYGTGWKFNWVETERRSILPCAGILSVYLPGCANVVWNGKTVFTDLLYTNVIAFQEGEFASGLTVTGLNSNPYIDIKDDVKLMQGTIPQNSNAPLIWGAGLSYNADQFSQARQWHLDGSSYVYGYAELISRMLLSLRRRPITVMQCNAIGVFVETIYTELNQPGIEYIFTGGSLELQTRKIDGQWVELLNYDSEIGTVSSNERVTSSNNSTYRSSGTGEKRIYGTGSGTPKRINDLEQEVTISNALRIEVDQADFESSKRVDVGQIVNHTISEIIDNDALKDYIGNNAGNGGIPDTRTILISGAIMWDTGLTFQSTKLVYKILGDDYQVSPQTITLDAADAALPRIDVFFVDTSSEVRVLKGIPAAIPVKPELGANDLEITLAYIPAGATEPDLDIETVYDEHTEWTAAETHDDNITVNFDATTTPVTGVKCLEVKITVPDTVIATPTHYVGERYQGGIIFYLAGGGKTGLIASEKYASVGVQYGEEHSSGPNAMEIGAGQANTAALMANAYSSTCAAYYAVNYEGGGFKDWFLGSQAENAELLFRKSLFPNFSGAIWSSSEKSGSDDWKRAWASNFDNSTSITRDKTNSFKVVPIRKFDDTVAVAGIPVDVVTPSSTVINFDAPTPITMINGIVSFYLKCSAEWLPNTAISIRLYNDAERVGRLVISKSSGMHGFNSADPEWQLIAVPATLFSMTSLTVNKVMIALVNSWPNNVTLSVDRLRIQHDSNQTPEVILTPGVYGSTTKHVVMTVDERGVVKGISEVEQEGSGGEPVVTTDLDFKNYKGIRLADGTETTDAVNRGQLDTAVSNAMSGVGSSIHVPVASVAVAKAIAAAGRLDMMLMLIETMGLYRFDSDIIAVSNDTTVILPADVSSDTLPGRWIKISSSITDHNLLSNILGNGGYHLSLAEREKLLGIKGIAELTSADASVIINGNDLSVKLLDPIKNITRSISFNDTVATIFRDYYKNDFRIAAIDLRGISGVEWSTNGSAFSPVMLPMTITGNSDIYWKVTFTGGATTGFINITGSDATVSLTTAVMRCISFNDLTSPVCRDYFKTACTISVIDKRSVTAAEYSLDGITFLPANLPLAIAANSDIYWRATFANGATSGFLNITGILN